MELGSKRNDTRFWGSKRNDTSFLSGYQKSRKKKQKKKPFLEVGGGSKQNGEIFFPVSALQPVAAVRREIFFLVS